MRLILFWLRILPSLPWIYSNARKANKLPYDQRYPLLKKAASMVIKAMRIDIEVIGKNNIPLQDGFLFAGNHQGTADAFIFINSCDVPITAVSKVEGAKIPFLSDWYNAMEVIFFKRESLKEGVLMARKLEEYLLKQRNVLIFPEGTRSFSQLMGDFKPGSFKGAVKAKVPIVPFALINAFIPIDSKQKRKTVKVVYCQPIHYEEYQDWSTRQLAEETKIRIQQVIYENTK